VREYYCYKLQIRPDEMNILLYAGRLFQQFLMDMYVKVESMRLDWYSLPKHQKKIRWNSTGVSSTHFRLVRHVLPRLEEELSCQKKSGGDYDVQARFLDAMILV
jgi:hypothetical protein